MKSRSKHRVRSPFLAWPSFIARQPGSIQNVVEGLMKSQWWSLDDIQSGWRFQLTLLLGWAPNNVPYYQKSRERHAGLQRIQRSKSAFWDEWSTLPVLTKTDLRIQGSHLRQTKLPQHHLPIETIKTSGSTGIPVETINTAVTARNWAALTIRDHLVWKRDFRERMGAIRFLPKEAQGPRGVDMPDWGKPVRDLYESAPGGAIHIAHPPDILAAWLRRLNPVYLLTYPSVAEQLLEEMQGPSGKPQALKEIRFMSEPLDEALEEHLQKEWGVRCADMYSANEIGHIALRCPEQGSLHVQAETVLVEILDESGTACSPGETGRIVVTPLHNLATPLIRYEIGDYATVGEPCPCGRASPVIRQVLGRVRNYARTPDGNRFWPSSLGMVRIINPIIQYQYVQVSEDTIEFRMVLSRPLTQGEEAKVVERVKTAMQYPFSVRLAVVDGIERGPTGKYEEFLSLINER